MRKKDEKSLINYDRIIIYVDNMDGLIYSNESYDDHFYICVNRKR